MLANKLQKVKIVNNYDVAKDCLYALMGGQSNAVDALEVIDPSNGAVIASIEPDSAPQIRQKISDAVFAQLEWAAHSPEYRRATLQKWHDLAAQDQDQLAALLTLEQGKSYKEAQAEIAASLKNIAWSADLCTQSHDYEAPSHVEGAVNKVVYEPLGVVAAITPWNFPSAMVTRKVAPALAAGCAVILKPAEDTPLSALALVKLAQKAGIPAEIFALAILPRESAALFSDIVFNDARVRMVSFTGSTAVGKSLIAASATNVTKLSLELGGNAPFIICADADLDKAVEGAFASKFRNAGQTCICANRLFVAASIYDQFIERFVARVAAAKIGNGFDDGVEIGPLIHARAYENMQKFLSQLQGDYAELIYRGHMDLPAPFVAPHIFACADECQAPQQEIFGPIACVYKFDDIDDVITRANETSYGLAAYVYGADQDLTAYIAQQLQFGMVGINEVRISDASIPFGGVKQSGIGREGGRDSLLNFMVSKYICQA